MNPVKRIASVIMAVLFFSIAMKAEITGAEEITLRLHCWSGYSKPYVESFRKWIKGKYGVNIRMEITNVSDPIEFWHLSRSKQVDLISPAHNILRCSDWPFIDKQVAVPVDLGNIPNYQYLLPVLRRNEFVTVKGEVYGVPYTMGTYGLAYNTQKAEAPETWKVLWNESSKHSYTISKDYSDCNIYITALALGATYENLYDIEQMASVMGLPYLGLSQLQSSPFQKKLNALAANAYSLWQGTANPDEFDRLSYAATWGYAVQQANKKGLKWKMADPVEGTTMWVDHWVVTYAVKDDPFKKRLCEEWIDYCLGKDLQIGVIRNWGVSPVVTNINESLTQDEIDTFHVGDNEYWKSLSLWKNQSGRTKSIYNMLWGNAVKARN